MDYGRSYLMDGCQVMAPGGGREHLPTIVTPTLGPSSCRRKKASLGANDNPYNQDTRGFKLGTRGQ
jgi:hypothetical protein